MKRTDYHKEISVIADFLFQQECMELIATAEKIGSGRGRQKLPIQYRQKATGPCPAIKLGTHHTFAGELKYR